MKNPITGLFQCESITHIIGGNQIAKLNAKREGNAAFSNYSRYGSQSGSFEILITDPEARDSFKPGRIYEFTINERPIAAPGTGAPPPATTIEAPQDPR